MSPNQHKIVAIALGGLLVLSVFLPALNFGSNSYSLFDGIDEMLNGNSVIILAFSLLNLVAAILGKYDYMQILSTGVLAVTLSLIMDLASIEAFESIRIGTISLVLFSAIGALGIKEIKLT